MNTLPSLSRNWTSLWQLMYSINVARLGSETKRGLGKSPLLASKDPSPSASMRVRSGKPRFARARSLTVGQPKQRWKTLSTAPAHFLHSSGTSNPYLTRSGRVMTPPEANRRRAEACRPGSLLKTTHRGCRWAPLVTKSCPSPSV